MGLMCVKERTARRRLAGNKWVQEVDVSRDVGTVWGRGEMSTLREEAGRDTETTWEIRVE